MLNSEQILFFSASFTFAKLNFLKTNNSYLEPRSYLGKCTTSLVGSSLPCISAAGAADAVSTARDKFEPQMRSSLPTSIIMERQQV